MITIKVSTRNGSTENNVFTLSLFNGSEQNNIFTSGSGNVRIDTTQPIKLVIPVVNN